MPTLAVRDGHNLAYRAFYALPDDLATSVGQVTNSVYGFTSMLIKIVLGDHHPDGLVVTWDTPQATFRKDEYPEYKAQREKAPDIFRSQLPLIREVVDTLGVRQIELPGFEADDIIATVAEEAKRDGWEVLIVSGDRDTFQLIDDHCRVLYIRRGISDLLIADEAWVEERYGIRSDQYPDYARIARRHFRQSAGGAGGWREDCHADSLPATGISKASTTTSMNRRRSSVRTSRPIVNKLF